jgi:hypothetical protein
MVSKTSFYAYFLLTIDVMDKTILACFYGMTLVLLIPLIFLHHMTITTTPIGVYLASGLSNGSTTATATQSQTVSSI